MRGARASSEWFSRPADEWFLSLGALARFERGRPERRCTRVVESALIHVEANRNGPKRQALILPGADAPATLTYWGFGLLRTRRVADLQSHFVCAPERLLCAHLGGGGRSQ